MSKGKKSGKLKPAPVRGKSGQKTPKRTNGRKPSRRSPSPRTVSLVDDAQIAQVAGIPDKTQLDEAADNLSPEDRKAFKRMRQLLAEHLGSHAAARLWLVSTATGFETTALDAVRNGQAKLVLATLESQWGPSPTYA
jgi:hypothetical protein